MKNFRKIITLSLSAALLLCGCGPSSDGDAGTTTVHPTGDAGTTTDHPADYIPEGNRIDLSEFTAILTPENPPAKQNSALTVFQSELSALTAAQTTTQPPESGKVIAVGNTADPVSAEATALLTGSESGHQYALLFKEDRIAIVGSDTDATLVGMKYFLTHYADAAEDGRIPAAPGDRYVGNFGDEITIFPNLVQWELKQTSVVDAPEKADRGSELLYPTIIELNHQPDGNGNGILIATGDRRIKKKLCPVYRSTDGGATWEMLTFLKDPYHPDFGTTFAARVFELPTAVGDMPEGTLIMGVDSINDAWDQIYIVLFRSYDQGLTWEAFTTVAEAHPHIANRDGVWEPNFVCTDDGTLIVYYSDDADPVYNQKLVYKASKDGTTWSDPVETVALDDTSLRPGMSVVTRMGDGRYVMVYELPGHPLHYKITDDPLDWGDPSDPGTQIQAGPKLMQATPGVAWAPVGGKDGMLVVTAWQMFRGTSKTGSDIFVSFDCGKSWTAIDNYYSYDLTDAKAAGVWWGYSASIFFSSDGKTMYYMATTPGDDNKPSLETSWYKVFKIEVT